MRLWLNRSSEIWLREQLMTQVVLGILCRQILPGHRLPSTRELARRFGIHPNTASAAYRELEEGGESSCAKGAEFLQPGRAAGCGVCCGLAAGWLRLC